MEPQDHIATLCAAGTLGIAATGLALGVPTKTDNTHLITPGKRKWPGASSSHNPYTTPQPSHSSRRTISQPGASSLPTTLDGPEHQRPISLFRRQSKRDIRPTTAHDSDITGSRGSSLNRNSVFRPRSADTRSTSERRDPSASSSWLKRISIISSPRATSPSAPSSKADTTVQSVASPAAGNSQKVLPNKLVKRSTSQRGLSHDQAKGTFLRRPATSHQRSATVQEWIARETSYSTPATPYLNSEGGPIWRPFFERGYPRKRHSTTDARDSLNLRTISASYAQQPTLMLGSHIEPLGGTDDQVETTLENHLEPRRVVTGRQRLRRSLSSVHRSARRRHFTDPVVKVSTEPVNGTFTSASTQSPLSPALQSSPFDVDLPHRSPSFSSSPSIIPVRHRFSFRKRQSTVPSDPTTASSDNDTRVFTDDDSMDFHSDTAYDSLTTRATVSSHSALRSPKLDNMFHDPHATRMDGVDATLAKLVQKATLNDSIGSHPPSRQSDHLLGMDIPEVEEENDEMDFDTEPAASATPMRTAGPVNEDYNMTPVPHRLHYFESPIKSSPPVLSSAAVNRDIATPEFVVHGVNADFNADEIDWSPKSEKEEKKSTSTLRPETLASPCSHPSNTESTSSQSFTGYADDEDNESDKRLSSIFDWSEHPRIPSDSPAGMMIRPKTVHGKQGYDGARSRSSGRKGLPQMHLRSQSVPNNRDPSTEQAPPPVSKFGTWGLGHKGVSEEWSDDFEFDDIEEDASAQIPSSTFKPANRSSSRGVKVPQAIIDSQASVHIQFGQVQEFMLLVEELKQLRARGTALQLLNDHSRQLWEDAESIIELATINEEDEPYRPPRSPMSNLFGDELLTASRTAQTRNSPEEARKNGFASRSVSNPATPSHGRPRGESLAQAKNLLQSIHQSRSGFDSSPIDFHDQPLKKLPFDTQDLKDLVVRSGVITRALKEIVRKAEGLSVSPNKTPPRSRDPAFSQIFNAPDTSPCPPFRKPGLPKSRSANSYLVGTYGNATGTVSPSPPPNPTPTALVL